MLTSRNTKQQHSASIYNSSKPKRNSVVASHKMPLVINGSFADKNYIDDKSKLRSPSSEANKIISTALSNIPHRGRNYTNSNPKIETHENKESIGVEYKEELRSKTMVFDNNSKKKLDLELVKDNIKVVARFRPYTDSEKELTSLHNSEPLINITDDKTIAIKGDRYTFDTVFKPDDSQLLIYDTIGKQTVVDILNGYNGTIFAYGNTNSGKTYTMFGDDIDSPEMMGMIPRIGIHIFQHIEQNEENTEFEIRCSILEIYKENLRDLLNKENNDLHIKESPIKGVFVEGLADPCVSSVDELSSFISIGQQMREVGSTRINHQSSRSHAIFILQIFQKLSNGNEKRGTLNLIDLAGSENVSKSGAEGKLLEEAKKINLSLCALCNVIHALTTSSDHVPYRDSKLTRILQESLGGNYKTSLIITCSSHTSHLQETISSLKFGRRAKAVKNSAKINMFQKRESYLLIIQSLKAELESARNELTKKQNTESIKLYPPEIKLLEDKDSISSCIDNYKSEIESLRSENKELKEKYYESKEEVKRLKILKFNIEKKCIEYEQIINSNKMQTQNYNLLELMNNMEKDMLKQEIHTLTDAINEIESDMYRVLKDKRNNFQSTFTIGKPNMTHYLGKLLVENGIKKSPYNEAEITQQIENDRQVINQCFEFTIPPYIEDKNCDCSDLVRNLKSKLTEVSIYNQIMQTAILSTYWKSTMDNFQMKLLNNINSLMEKQNKICEDMVESTHQSMMKLFKYIEKLDKQDTNTLTDCPSFFKQPSYLNICSTGKSKIRKTTSKYSLMALNANSSSRAIMSLGGPHILHRIALIRFPSDLPRHKSNNSH